MNEELNERFRIIALLLARDPNYQNLPYKLINGIHEQVKSGTYLLAVKSNGEVLGVALWRWISPEVADSALATQITPPVTVSQSFEQEALFLTAITAEQGNLLTLVRAIKQRFKNKTILYHRHSLENQKTYRIKKL